MLVNGRTVLKEGKPTGFDLKAMGAEAAAQLEAAPDKAAYRSLAKAVRPYMQKWYASWPAPELTPFAAFNSKDG